VCTITFRCDFVVKRRVYKLCNKMQFIVSVSVLLGCDTLSVGIWFLMFQDIVVVSFQDWKVFSGFSTVEDETTMLSLTLILPRSRTGTVWFYTSTSNKRAA